jgi:NADH-quinone oxidoreductase subunit N
MAELQRLTAAEVLHLAPELTLVIFAIALSLIDLIMPRTFNRNILGWLAIVGVAISAMFVIGDIRELTAVTADQMPVDPISLLLGSYRIDNFANLLKLVFLAGTGLILFMSLGSVKENDFPHVGEFYYLFLPATIGAMIMASSADLITLYVGIELLSITSYIMVGMRKKHGLSNEASFKYVTLGSISSAFILYGMSFLYGMTGSTHIAEINAILSTELATFDSLIYVSFFLLLTGFGFKIGAAPFHAWAPDVYQGAPSPVTAFLAVVSKAAGFAILFRVFYGVFGIGRWMSSDIHKDIFLTLAVLAALAMIIGNTVALKQKNMKRLLAYSGIANAGYLLVPIASHFGMFHFSNFSEFMYYLVAYLFMNIGAIAVLMLVSNSKTEDDISSFSGLYYRAPWTAVAMVILLLSFAGFPITGGFFGKLFILLGTLQTQMYWLPAVMIATSIVSYYYYFGIIRQMFMRSSSVEEPIVMKPTLLITIWLCTAATVAMGLYPQGVLGYFDQVFSLTRDLFILQ